MPEFFRAFLVEDNIILAMPSHEVACTGPSNKALISIDPQRLRVNKVRSLKNALKHENYQVYCKQLVL